MNSALAEIRRLASVPYGSEDDLILKVVVPFFRLLGYRDEQVGLKYPVRCYRTARAGRKPEADCVFFSGADHNVDTSLLVVEVKRDQQPPPEAQARFYSSNLFVPFYVTWEAQSLEVYQLHAFRAPRNLGCYSLREMSSSDYEKLRTFLSPPAIERFCKTNVTTYAAMRA